MSSASVAGVAIGVSVISVAVYAFSYLLVYHYIERKVSRWLILAAALPISIGLFGLLLIPFDVFIVSSNLNADGTQHAPDNVRSLSQAIGYLYYVFYTLIAVFGFIILPYTFFYYEEDDDQISNQKRMRIAATYTGIFVFVGMIVVVLGLVLKSNKGGESHDWTHDVSKAYTSGDAMLSFTIGSLLMVGLCGWVTYTAYGMAYVPVWLCRNRNEDADTTYAKLVEDNADINKKIALNKENQKYMSADSGIDQNRIVKELQQEERKLQASLMQNKPDEDELDFADKIWNIIAPVRSLLAALFFCLSMLIVVSQLLSSVDKFTNSKCKYSCGYAISEATMINPLDSILTAMASYFPADLILFGIISIYIFLCTVVGLVTLGVRAVFFHLFSIRKRATMPNAMIMASWILMFIVLVVNLEMEVITPQYIIYGGDQRYINLSDTSSSSQVCSITNSRKIVGHNNCFQTKLSAFKTKIDVQLPFFGAALFFGNAAFVLSYFFFVIWKTCDCGCCWKDGGAEEDIWNDD